jgi:spore coat polysaccharide biosynthesis protein SpsF
MLKVAAIVQARMGSARLPGKVLLDIAGKTMLARVVERLSSAKSLDGVLVATTDSPHDDVIVEECRRLSIAVFRGQVDDVLDRYYQAAQSIEADVVVRITSDCPLIDPEVTDQTIQEFLAQRPDYASNVMVRTYPRGLDTEVVTAQALRQAWSEADQAYQRAHVTPYIYEHPEKFKLLSVTGEQDYSQHRWTVDTPEDLELMRVIYQRLGWKGDFLWRDVLALFDDAPELAVLNRGVAQKALRLG